MLTTATSNAGSTTVPSAEELIERAKALAPAIAARARQTAKEGNVPAESVAEIRDAGLLRILQPKRYGGYEMHPNVFFDVQKILAEACMSTGWIYGVLGCHPYELALFDDRAQQDVWGDNPDMLVSSTYQPVGKVEKADGGFYLSGRWGFSSGSTHCGWVLLGAMYFPEEGGPPDMRTFLLPRPDYQVIEGTWDVFGLQGTGSFDIVVERVFVPEYRTHRSADGFACNNPGQKENTAALYRLPWAQVFTRSVSTSAFGAIRAIIKGATEIMGNRISTNTGKASKADPMLHAALARAISESGEMERTHRASFDEMMALAEAGQPVPMDKRALYTYQSSNVVRRMVDMADDIIQLLGGRAVYMSSPVIQPWLDLNAARAHVANDPNNRTSDVLVTLAGEPAANPFL